MQTEETIIANLRKNYPNCLLIIISHRLAIFSQIDRIVLLHSDRAAEYGTHRQLMEDSELYATIYNLQQLAGDRDEE
ncbi:MAG: antibiotic transporter ATPase [Firmicutes bacterium]|nr:antibiotic transporter ATPase [Bacillota bacterium]